MSFQVLYLCNFIFNLKRFVKTVDNFIKCGTIKNEKGKGNEAHFE